MSGKKEKAKRRAAGMSRSVIVGHREFQQRLAKVRAERVVLAQKRAVRRRRIATVLMLAVIGAVSWAGAALAIWWLR